MNLLGWPFCAKCKENQFQSTGARQTARKTSPETAPRDVHKHASKIVDFGDFQVRDFSLFSLGF